MGNASSSLHVEYLRFFCNPRSTNNFMADTNDATAVDHNRHRKWVQSDRIRMVRLYYEHAGNARRVRRAWSVEVPRARPPFGRTVRSTVARFQQTGDVRDRPRSGKPRSVTLRPTVDLVSESVRREPTISTRERARRLGISRTSLLRVLHDRLSLRAYKIQIAHYMREPLDTTARLRYSRAILRLSTRYANLPSRLIMSDEAHFHLTGEVFNRQNVRFWGSANPRLFRVKDPHSARITVWCGIAESGIIGPYFFANDRGETVSVTGDRYRDMIVNYVLPFLRDDPRFNVANGDDWWWWQQDGATAHTARATMTILATRFGRERVISGKGAGRPPTHRQDRRDNGIDANADDNAAAAAAAADYDDDADGERALIHWPSRSPDLSAADFFLWGYLKDRVYDVTANVANVARGEPMTTISPPTLATLRDNISREIARLNAPEAAPLLRAVMHQVLARARACVHANGGHLKDILFKTT